MFRIITFTFVIAAVAMGFAWLADHPGNLSIVLKGYHAEMPLTVAVSIILALYAATLFTWWLLSTIWNSPKTTRRFFNSRKRDRGYQALSTGLIAAGSGNALLARKMSARAQGLLNADLEPLIHLLDAQANLIEGNYDAARSKFEAMAATPETRELGLRGLYIEARRQGALEAASQYAEKAAEEAPYLPWAAQATLENRCRDGKWDEAILLLDQQRIAKVIKKEHAERLKAVLLTAKASELLDSDPSTARDCAKQALKYSKYFVPAALIAAKAYLREDSIRKAGVLLETLWKNEPHPQIAQLFLRLRSGDTAVDRLKRAEKFEALKPNNVESLFIVAQAALDAQKFDKAREKAEAAARISPRESIYLLLAEIEEAQSGDQGRMRHWLAQAVRAPKDPAWVADGIVSEKWLPYSPVNWRLDAFEWKTPFDQLSSPVEEAHIENAIATLPAISEPIVKEKIIEVPVIKEVPIYVTAPEAKQPTSTSTVPIKETQIAALPNDEQQPKLTHIDEPPKRGKKMNNNDHNEAVPFFGGAPDDPGVRKPEVSQNTAIPSSPVVTQSVAKTEDNHIHDAVPFLGGAPDDPGVKTKSTTQAPKTRLDLF